MCYGRRGRREGGRKRKTDRPTDRRKHISDTQPGLLRVKCLFYLRRLGAFFKYVLEIHVWGALFPLEINYMRYRNWVKNKGHPCKVNGNKIMRNWVIIPLPKIMLLVHKETFRSIVRETVSWKPNKLKWGGMGPRSERPLHRTGSARQALAARRITS